MHVDLSILCETIFIQEICHSQQLNVNKEIYDYENWH